MSFFEKLKNFDHTLFVWFIAFIHTPYPWILMALCTVAFDVHRYLTVGKFDTVVLFIDLPMVIVLLLQAYYFPKLYQNREDKKDKN